MSNLLILKTFDRFKVSNVTSRYYQQKAAPIKQLRCEFKLNSPV
jgi:hypothetical protein